MIRNPVILKPNPLLWKKLDFLYISNEKMYLLWFFSLQFYTLFSLHVVPITETPVWPPQLCQCLHVASTANHVFWCSYTTMTKAYYPLLSTVIRHNANTATQYTTRYCFVETLFFNISFGSSDTHLFSKTGLFKNQYLNMIWITVLYCAK